MAQPTSLTDPPPQSDIPDGVKELLDALNTGNCLVPNYVSLLRSKSGANDALEGCQSRRNFDGFVEQLKMYSILAQGKDASAREILNAVKKSFVNCEEGAATESGFRWQSHGEHDRR